MKEYSTDILLVSNFSTSLDKTHNEISSFFTNDIKYKILTYRKTDIKNSHSYEEFLENNFEYVKNYDIEDIQKRYKDVNLFLPMVTERFLTNYYFAIEYSLGNKSMKYEDMMFFIKSFVLFLEEYISNSKLIFSGYADNFISALTYYLSIHYNKECLAFHNIAVINTA